MALKDLVLDDPSSSFNEDLRLEIAERVEKSVLEDE